jgi:hypothetical protein
VASNLGDKIIKIVANSQGVKAGVDQAAAELRRLERAAVNAGKSLDKALKENGANVFTPTVGGGVNSGSSSRRGAAGRNERLIYRGLEDLAVVLSGQESAAKAFSALSKNLGIYQGVVKDAADKFVRSEIGSVESANAVRDANLKLARAIQFEADIIKSRIANPNLVLGTKDGGAGVPSLRLGDTGRDQSDSDGILDNIRKASAPAVKQQTELADELTDRIREERRLRGILKQLGGKQESLVASIDDLNAAIKKQVSVVQKFAQRAIPDFKTVADLKKDAPVRAGLLTELSNLGATFDDLQKFRDPSVPLKKLEKAIRERIKAQFDEISRIQQGVELGDAFRAGVAADKTLAGVGPNPVFRDIRFTGSKAEKAVEALIARTVDVYDKLSGKLQSVFPKVGQIVDRLAGKLPDGIKRFLFDSIDISKVIAKRINDGFVIAKESAGRIVEAAKGTRLGRAVVGIGSGISSVIGAGRGPDSPSLASQFAGGAASLATKATGFVAGGLRKVGGFIFTEFTNFVSRVAANLTSRLIAGAVEGLERLAVKFVESAARFEDALVSFGVLAGSEGRGAALVGELQKLAVDTPFRLQEVLDESKLLLSYGVSVDDLTKRLRQLGDVASGTGVDLGRLSLAFGQTLAKGRLQGPEIRQFTEAGVAIRDFADAFNELTGKNVSNRAFLDLVERGEVSSKVVEKAFDRMTGAGGRFFNFMEVRSKTVSGRFNALLESFELFAQKVGKSLFDRLGVGTGIDALVKKLQGVNFDQIDRVIADFAPPIQKFAVQVFSGFEAFIKSLFGNVFGGISVKSFSDFLKFTAESLFPKLIDGGFFLVDAFLAAGQGVLKFVEVVEAVYSLLPNTSAGSGKNVTAILGGFGTAALAGAAFGGPVGALAGVTAAAGFRAFGFNAFSKPKPGSESDLARLAGVNLGEFRERLAAANGSSVFERAAKERAEFELRREASAQEVARQRLAEQANADLAKQNAATPGFKISDQQFQKNLAANLVATIGIESDRRKALAAIHLVLSNREYQRKVAETNKVFDDKKAGLNDPRFVSSNVTASDVKDYVEVALKFNSAMKKLNEQFLDSANNKVPGFTKRIEELVKKLPDIGRDEGDDLRKDLQAIAIAGSAQANLLGIDNALKKSEVDKLLGQRTLDFIAKFKSPDLQPAPLVRQGSQEAEQALTRAIYESRNVNKPIEQQLLEAEQNQATILEGIRSDLKEAAEAAKGRIPNANGVFLAVGMPP